MFRGAQARGVPIKGEHALAGGVWASYSGLTVLRIAEVTDNTTGRTRYQSFIRKNR